MAALYQQLYGLETVGLRYMNIFGPRQNPGSPYSGVISLFCQAALQGLPCRVHGDGEQTRDFVYVEDVVRANLQAAMRPYAALAARPIFNVGSGRQTSLNEMLRLLGEIVEREMTAVYGPPRQGDIRHSVADIRYAQSGLDFRAHTSFSDGLRATLDWDSKQAEQLQPQSV
jgi:nucleoside-diphosphate-sugar epimerase